MQVEIRTPFLITKTLSSSAIVALFGVDFFNLCVCKSICYKSRYATFRFAPVVSLIVQRLPTNERYLCGRLPLPTGASRVQGRTDVRALRRPLILTFVLIKPARYPGRGCGGYFASPSSGNSFSLSTSVIFGSK